MKRNLFCAPTGRSIRLCITFAAYGLYLAAAFSATAHPFRKDALGIMREKLGSVTPKQKRRFYILLDHLLRICLYAFLSAVFAGLTLGVMCANTFTLEIIAESGPKPDCKYAATLLPLRKQGHKTLSTLIISNMLCNVLIVQEFSDVFDVVEAIRTRGTITHVVDDSGSGIWKFIVSTLVIVLFAEILPMSICCSKYSLRVAAAGSIFVKVAMILTYPLSVSLGWFLDVVVGSEETGQLYDKKELRKLMVMHYERGGGDDARMPKSELNLLLAAMDFHERKVRDIMTPIEKATYVRNTDLITPDFVEMLWKSGRSRVPVESAPGVFESILVVKDLMTVNTSLELSPLTVAQVVKSKDRRFAMVCTVTSLPSMLKLFLEEQTHMAVVFEEDPHSVGAAIPAIVTDVDSRWRLEPSASRSFASTHPKIVGILTMEDVVEELLASEIYDEYDRYNAVEQEPLYATVDIPGNGRYPKTLHLPKEPKTPPRVNFYSYFTHPTESILLTDSQVWAVAYYLNRTVSCFYSWQPAYIKLLLEECKDLQLCSITPSQLSSTADLPSIMPPGQTPDIPSMISSQTSGVLGMSSRSEFFFKGGHTQFLNAASDQSHILYSRGIRSDRLLLVLGGCVELLVGSEGFRSKLQSFNYIGEGALTTPLFIPDFSAVVLTAARVYSIPKALFDKYYHYQSINRERSSNVCVLSPSLQSTLRPSVSRQAMTTMAGSECDSLLGHRTDGIQALQRQYGTTSKKTG
ncbi:putative Cyclin M transmembrane N-terminal domain containing protein [Leishmania shawi]|uniref:Cyclin M transmembrane N-terminal domain containing protein n=1 Tax=Leishmania shawi TaxID=5680 RepID=A0AAW3BY12_9TRYP